MSRVTPEHIEARTTAIRDAALDLFSRRGLNDTTMQEIAAAVGISPGAIYLYYENKESLLQAVLNHCVEESHALIARLAAENASPVEVLRELGRTVWAQFDDPSARPSFIIQLEASLAAARDPESFGTARARLRNAAIDLIAGLILQAQERRELDASADARGLARLLVAVTEGMRVLVTEAPERADTQPVLDILTRLVEGLFIAGSGPRTVRSSSAKGG